jgi:hypothetical protein
LSLWPEKEINLVKLKNPPPLAVVVYWVAILSNSHFGLFYLIKAKATYISLAYNWTK